MICRRVALSAQHSQHRRAVPCCMRNEPHSLLALAGSAARPLERMAEQTALRTREKKRVKQVSKNRELLHIMHRAQTMRRLTSAGFE